jgi:hypothetical protein
MFLHPSHRQPTTQEEGTLQDYRLIFRLYRSAKNQK